MKKVIFVRVPRTASTNFTGILENIYKPKMIRDLVWQEMPAKKRTAKLKRGEYFYDFDNMKYPAKNIRKYNAIEGHFYAKKYEELKDDYDFVTFLRDPLQRVISHFHIIVKRQDRLGIDIKKFAEIYKNFHKALLGDDLSMYKFIGITDMFNFSVNEFYEIFEIPEHKRTKLKGRSRVRRGAVKKRKISEADRKYIINLNKEDYEIYNEVKAKLTEKRKKLVKLYPKKTTKKKKSLKKVVKKEKRLSQEMIDKIKKKDFGDKAVKKEYLRIKKEEQDHKEKMEEKARRKAARITREAKMSPSELKAKRRRQEKRRAELREKKKMRREKRKNEQTENTTNN